MAVDDGRGSLSCLVSGLQRRTSLSDEGVPDKMHLVDWPPRLGL